MGGYAIQGLYVGFSQGILFVFEDVFCKLFAQVTGFGFGLRVFH